MKKEIQALKAKLPKRGYTQLVMENTTDDKGKQLITIDIIKQFFAGRKVKHENKIIVIKGVKAAIEKLNKKELELKSLMKA